MGQLYHACVYDTDNRVCYVMDADKFQSNCYAHSEPVIITHYLLRQKSFNVMWGGEHVTLDRNITYFKRRSDLEGISTFTRPDVFDSEDVYTQDKIYCDKVAFVKNNYESWRRLDAREDALRTIQYTGFLVNHTKRFAVDLEKYYEDSSFRKMVQGVEIQTTVDAIAVLTDTGGGVGMLSGECDAIDTLEHFAGQWCGDLLQITSEIPVSYAYIRFCFAEV